MAEYKVTDTELTYLADKIRAKGGTEETLEWPTGFGEAVDDMSSAVIQPLSVTQNGTFNPPSGVDGYAPVTVNVPSSGGGSAVRITTKSTGGMDASVNVYEDEVFVETVLFTDVSAGAYKDYAGVRLMYNVPAADSPDGVAHSGWCVFVGSHLINAWTYSTTTNTAVNVSGGALPVKPQLPAEYQEVQYVHFINAYYAITSIPFYVGVMMLEAEYDDGTIGAVCGYRGSSTSPDDWNFGRGGWYLRAGNAYMDASADVSGNHITAKGVLPLTPSVGSSGNAYIGNYNPSGGSGSNLPFSGKFYYFAILKPVSNEWAMYCIPCYRKSDNVVGMYDAVNSVFYTPNSGSFTAGPDAN